MSGLILFASSVGALEIVRYVLREFHGDGSVRGAETAETSRPTFQEVTVSSPGKVLIAGGYLILEKENLGITVAGTSRFYATVRTSVHSSSQKQSQTALCIVVRSPQFHESYLYGYNVDTDHIFAMDGDNVFVAKCLQLVFTFLRAHSGLAAFQAQLAAIRAKGRLEIVLQADNDFYSQNEQLQSRFWPVSASSLRRLPRFLPCAKGGEWSPPAASTSSSSSLRNLCRVLLQRTGRSPSRRPVWARRPR